MGAIRLKRTLCVLFSLILVLGLIPGTVYAEPLSEEESDLPASVTETTDEEAAANVEDSSVSEAQKSDDVSDVKDSSSENESLNENNSASKAEAVQSNDGNPEATANRATGITSLSLSTNSKQAIRWTYSSTSYAEFYVAAYDEAENELSFDVDYSVEDASEKITIDLADLVNNVANINDGTYAYDFVYATVYGIDYSNNSHKSDESYWQTLGSENQPITKLVITYSRLNNYSIWGYEAYSGDDLLGTIKVRAHDDSTYPYIYLQLWCSQGDALPVVAKNVNTGAEYAQLDAAIGGASAEDTVQLLNNIDVEVTKTNEFSIDKNLTLDLNKNTIAVSCSNNSYHLFNIASGVDVTIKNGTIDGGDSQAAGNALYGNGASANLTEVTLDNLTIQNFGASSNYGTIYVYDGSLTATNCTFSNNGNSATNLRSSAGDANLHDGTALTLDSCTISGNTNSTNNYGGGVGVRQIAKANITNCTVTGNKFESKPSGIYGGGGIVLYNVGEITLDKNTITGNESSMYGGGVLILSGSSFNLGDKTTISNNTITNNTAHSNGGGLAYYINAAMHTDEAYCTFTGNAIDNNYSSTMGGGMSMYSNDPDFVFTIYSGTVNNNKANDSGGGIDFAWERPATLQLYSTVITENVAAKGGGVWLCPTSETRMYVTFGGAIYGNEARESAEETQPCGDGIRFEGDVDGDDFAGMVVNIVPRALGGTLMDWYTDEFGARYSDGLSTLIQVTSAEYTDRTEKFSVRGELSESGIILAKDEATTVISGNEAEQGDGGGIASNAVLVFGEDTTTEVAATKEWKDERGTTVTDGLPTSSVDVTLVRVDENGNKADLETVTLDKDSGWTWTFKDLPTNYTYEVRESTTVKGYAPSYKIEKNNEGNYVTVVTNAPGAATPGTGNEGPTRISDGYGDNGAESNSSGAQTGDTTPFIALIVLAVAAAALVAVSGTQVYRNRKHGLHRN